MSPTRLRVALVLLLVAFATPAAAQPAFGLDGFTIPLDATRLRIQSQGASGIEAVDPTTGWTWTVAQIGGGKLTAYPEPAKVRGSLAKRSGLATVTDLSATPLGDAVGSWYAGVAGGQVEQVCFVGKDRSLWVVSVTVPTAAQEESADVHKALCKQARWSASTAADPREVVGMHLNPSVWLDWQAQGDNQAAFNQSSTGLTGLVARAPREGHPYDTDDVGILSRSLATAGFLVHGVEFVPVGGRDAARVEVARVSEHGAKEDWLLVVLRGPQSLWVVQSPARSLALPRHKELLDAVLAGAKTTVE